MSYRKHTYPKLFQLHHTGIKTARSHEVKNPKKKFQLHHTGIKTDIQEMDLRKE